MQDELQRIESTPAIKERRARPRLRPTSLIYIDIGKLNGGIVTSLSENGLALTAAAALKNAVAGDGPDGPLQMRIQFPGIAEAIEASGEIVWTSPSGKEARVQFVELAVEAREQIHRWVSDQADRNGLWPEPPKLPKMLLPNSLAAKTRSPRFSFSDVASSRVDPEDEATREDFPEIATQPGELSALPPGMAASPDATEAMASAFASTAFIEQKGKIHFPGNACATQSPTQELPRQRLSPSTPERRQHSRRQILLFTYAALGENNGGLVFNLGENGMALTAAATLQEHHFAKIRLRIPDSEEWIETSGRLAWKNDSGKEAGIEFAGLSEDARVRLRDWVSQEELEGDCRAQEDTDGGSQSAVQKLPSFMETEDFSSEPVETLGSFEEPLFEHPAFEEHSFEKQKFEKQKKVQPTQSALFKAGIKGVFERVSVRRRVARIKPPRFPDHSAKPRTRVALRIAAGVAIAAGGWMLLQRPSLKEASGLIAQNVPTEQPAHEVGQSPEATTKTPVDAVNTVADSPVQLNENASEKANENAAMQTDTDNPSGQQIQNESPAPSASKVETAGPSANPGRPSKEKLSSEEFATPAPSAGSAPRSSDRTQRTAPSKHKQETKAARITPSASVRPRESTFVFNKPREIKPAESKAPESTAVQIAQAFSPPNRELNAAAPSLSSAPSQPARPAPAPAVETEKEKPLAAPKQPEATLARTPVVTVSFDPYPSIRMPKKEGSKKSQQGKSLQMGRLLTRVDPIYPEEARQQGVEGTVRLHAIFGREGNVQSVTSESGPSLLVPAAIKAVGQWRYSQTVLGGQAMETEEDVTVLFRLASPNSKN